MAARHPNAPEAVIFVGIQGSGKSTFYLERFFYTHVCLSLDVVRTRHREELIFEACLRAGQSFVIDNTNPLPADRARYVPASRTAGFRLTAYYFQTSLQDAIRRNNQRQGKQRVPVPAIAGTLKKLQPPTIGEGFDAIYTVELGSDNQFSIIESAG